MLEEVRQFWTEMTVHLDGEEAAVDYIRHYWVSRYEFVRTNQLYERIKGKTHSARSAYDTAAALRDHAKLYAALSNPEAELWRDFSHTTRRYARTLIDAVLKPLAIAVLRKFSERPKDVELAFHYFLNWSVRFLIVGGHRSEAVEVPFAKAAVQVLKWTVDDSQSDGGLRWLPNSARRHLP